MNFRRLKWKNIVDLIANNNITVSYFLLILLIWVLREVCLRGVANKQGKEPTRRIDFLN